MFCGNSIVLQVLLADVLSTLMLVFFLTVWPMEDNLNNAIHIFNEIMVLVCIWMMFLFTDYVPEPSTKYDLAWYLIYLIVFNITVNLGVFFYTTARQSYTAARGACHKRNVKNAIDKRVKPKVGSLDAP